MRTHKLLARFGAVYATGVVVLLWYILHFALRSAAIPSPYTTAVRFVRIFPGTLSIHMLVSFLRILAAVVPSLVFGVALGLWVGDSRRAAATISPLVNLLYPLPKIAFLPILMRLFGRGNTPKIILILIIIIFQFVLAARDGVREIPKELYVSVQSLGIGKAAMVRHLLLPACAPKIFTALRIGTGVSISVLFFSENFATTYGIGYFIMNAWAMADYVDMFSGILLLGLFGLLAFYLIDLAERRLCRWARLAESAR